MAHKTMNRRELLSYALCAGGTLLLGLGSTAAASSLFRIKRITLSGTQHQAQVVLHTSAPVKHTLFTLQNPDRVVIDIKNAHLATAAALPATPHIVQSVRYAVRNGQDLRVVLDLTTQAKTKSFLLPPSMSVGHRLVVELTSKANVKVAKPASVVATAVARPRNMIIAIDAGHGGKDPGAIGKGGTQEKDVVLAIAKRLKARLDKEAGVRAVLTRSQDEFLSLRERLDRARQANADVFVSIHADAAPKGHARGSSVYILSHRGASSEAARWLAERENAAGLVGGVTLGDKDDLLAEVLLDLSQTATRQASLRLGDMLLGELKDLGKLRSSRVEEAGFVVLKSPDIPSVLVETAFISNPGEEKRLKNATFQANMATSLAKGLRQYLQAHAPPGTVLAGG